MQPTKTNLIVAVFVGAALMGFSLDVSAFTRTLDQATNEICLWWAERKVGYHINDRCSDDINEQERDKCFEAVRQSFKAWTDVDCSDFEFVEIEITARTDVGFDDLYPEKNINLVMWQETDWDHDLNAVGLTTTTYDTNSGLIVDTDIELNGLQWGFAVDGNQHSFDIQNTITHEAGHALGLDHSSYIDATMNDIAITGETMKRDLHEDDINGICFMYPMENLTPPFYLDSNSQLRNCGIEGLEGYPSGCQCGGSHDFSFEILLAAGFLWLCHMRRYA